MSTPNLKNITKSKQRIVFWALFFTCILASCQPDPKARKKNQSNSEVLLDYSNFGKKYVPAGRPCPKPHYVTVRMPQQKRPKIRATSESGKALFANPALLWNAPYLLYLEAKVANLDSILMGEVGIPEQIEFNELGENAFTEEEKAKMKALFPKSRVLFFKTSEKKKMNVIDQYYFFKGGNNYFFGRYILRKNPNRGYLYADINPHPDRKEFDQVALWEADSSRQIMGISSSYVIDTIIHRTSRFYELKEGNFQEISAEIFSKIDEAAFLEKMKSAELPDRQIREILAYIKQPDIARQDTPFFIRFREKEEACYLMSSADPKRAKLITEMVWTQGHFELK